MENLVSDLMKLCLTAPNPFACVNEKLVRKPILEGIVTRTVDRVYGMIFPSTDTVFKHKKYPKLKPHLLFK